MGVWTVPVAEVSDDPWTIWESSSSVLELLERREINHPGQQDVNQSHTVNLSGAMPQTKEIDRKQYMSILNRMNQAAGRAGSFAQWNAAQT